MSYSYEYNKDLSAQRAEEVFSIASNFLNENTIGRISGGEKSNGHLDEARRVDVLVWSNQSQSQLSATCTKHM